ncbi:MAG: GHKL domain-containing protein [Lachnospiraceae bacterium]|nr:GHKL domain-containing protein [Lachnospiraceae bacterium]
MIHIAIVEDEQAYVTQFTEYLRRYEQESGNRLNISVFRDGEHILNNYRAVYDIIPMDIQMRLMDGMTAAEKIREQDQDLVIIFITNMAQYAIRGYAVDALDYVLKPVNYFAFFQRLDRAIGRMKKKEQYFLVISTREGSRKVAALEIKDKEKRLIHLTVTAQKGFVLIHVENYYEGELKYDGGTLLSTKGDDSFHGYGVKSIRYSAEKYGGTVSISPEKNWFDLRVLIPAQEK